MDILEAINKAAGTLPKGYQIVIRIENGAACVELETPDEVMSFCNDSDSNLARDILTTLDEAIEYSRENLE